MENYNQPSEIKDRARAMIWNVILKSGFEEITSDQVACIKTFVSLLDENGRMRRGLYIFGQPGNGKTTIARIFSTVLYFLNHEPRMISAVDLVLRCQNDTKVVSEFGSHKGAVIIDDIGVSGWTVRSYGNEIPVMDYLLMLRYERFISGKCPTIITSNVPFSKLADMVSVQVYDRLEEMTAPVEFVLKSKRGTK